MNHLLLRSRDFGVTRDWKFWRAQAINLLTIGHPKCNSQRRPLLRERSHSRHKSTVAKFALFLRMDERTMQQPAFYSS
ncbi:hypothetical protein [Phaffia rhodozyma]|uniref:Uncharacterized protein n=1 Tax=Phaffia rhodozyma TaxID=264483 RepID=A0A0F7SFW3_PHARH|nr:hypothetical protein [Phaffia rhodozyma]